MHDTIAPEYNTGQQPPKRKRHWLRWTLASTGGFIIAIIALAAALGGGTKMQPVAAAPSPSASAPAAQPQRSDSTPGYVQVPADPGSLNNGVVGRDTFTITGGSDGDYTVKAVSVTDPAQGGNEFDTPDAGHHFVGVKFTLHATTSVSKEDSDLDALVVGTDGQVYTPSFHSLAAGTDFNNGDITMSAGETLNGTVAFELPDGVKVASIKWTPAAGFASVHGTWRTPAGLSA